MEARSVTLELTSDQKTLMESNAAGLLARNRARYMYWLAAGLAALVYCLISLGGLVRGAGAGLSCPDWPLCHGQVVPTQMFSDQQHPTPEAKIPGAAVSPVAAHANGAQIFLEWFHRLIAGTVSVTLLVLSILVFASRSLRAKVGRHCSLALALLASQVVFGGLTVLGLLSPKWVVLHLATGLAFFSVTLWIALSLRPRPSDKAMNPANRKLGRFAAPRAARAAACTAAIIYLQAFLGGLVSSNYAGLACPDFPTCNGMWIPPFEGFVKFQFLHRLGALVATLTLIGFTISASLAKATPFARRALMAIPGLLTVQILLGVGMIFFQLPLLMSVAHLAVAAALLGALLTVTHEFRRG